MTCVTDYTTINTTPGATGPDAAFAPPKGFHGDGKVYLRWLKDERLDSLKFMLWFYTGQWSAPTMTVSGPYVEAFKHAFAKVKAKYGSR